jgi:hypothetical protein
MKSWRAARRSSAGVAPGRLRAVREIPLLALSGLLTVTAGQKIAYMTDIADTAATGLPDDNTAVFTCRRVAGFLVGAVEIPNGLFTRV